MPQIEQDRAHPLDIRRLAADHDCQAAGLGTGRAAGHRGIDPAHAGAARQLRGHFPGGGRLQAGKVHQQLAGPGSLGDTLGTEHHLAHHLGIGQAQQHQVRGLAQPGRGLRQSRTRLQQRRAFFPVAIPHHQGITRRQQTATHGQAHQANTGEPEGG
ncbi:hypothetical protein A3218_06335 [Pseudomonas chlororaphis]|nr:hypothetical protein A3218_06335 [Pseudomonas chlororaphis]